jgi:hypothetical protein
MEDYVGQVIADIGKNSREIIRVEVSEFKGKELINLRIWYQTFDGGYKPTQKGITLDLSQYGELEKAIAKIGQYVEDRKKGVIPDLNVSIEDSLTDEDVKEPDESELDI